MTSSALIRPLLVPALLACVACARPTPSAQEPEEVVRQFFTRLPEGDCRVLGPLLVERAGAPPCPATVDELNRHGMRLVEVLDVRVDGRDPEARLVRARLRQGSQERAEPALLRLERQEGRWRLRL